MKNQSLYKDIRLYTFLGIIAFLFFHHFGGYYGHYGFDDVMGYGYFGKKWADGHLFFLNEDFFSYRWGFISLTGFFYALLGMSDHTSAIAPSLVLLATVLLIFKVLKGQTRIVAVIAAVVYALDNWTIYYSDKLMPDTTVALTSFAAFVTIYNYRFERKGAAPIKHALLLSLILIAAYMTKQTVLLLFPVFFLLFLIDIFQKQHLIFWKYTVLFCVLMGLLYLSFIYLLTGHPLMRFKVAEAGHAANLGRSFAFCNYAAQSWDVLWYRIGYEMIFKFLTTGMLFSLILALPALFKYKIKDILTFKTPTTYWIFVLLLSILSSNFMTTSYKAYLPMCPDIRHFLFLVPMAAVVGAPIVWEFATEKKHRISILILAALAFFQAWWWEIGNFEWAYMGLLGGIVLRAILPNNRWTAGAFLAGLSLILLAPVISSMQTANENGYVEQRSVIYKYLKGKPHPSKVITNTVQKHFGWYYMEFEDHAPTQFYGYDAIPKLNFSSDTTIYVLTNGMTRYMSGMGYDPLPRCIKDCYEGKHPSSIEVLYETKKVALYKLKNPQLLQHKE